MMQGRKSLRFVLAGDLSTIGALPLAISQAIPGFESQSHVAKTAFLMDSFSRGNFTGWSEFWYSGFQVFYTYPPLTYLLAAAFGWPFQSALLGMKILIVLSFILSGTGAFALCRDLGVSSNWSLAAGLLYSLAPPHVLFLFDQGTLSYALAFALCPFFFLSLRNALARPTLRTVIYLGAVGALFLLTNDVSLYVLFFPLLAYLLVSTPKSRVLKTVLVVFSSSTTAFLLSAFWLIPYLEYDASGQLNLLGPSTFLSPEILHWYSFLTPNFQFLIQGYLGWILLMPALACIVFLRTREEFGLYAAALTSLILSIGPTLTPLFYRIPFILRVQSPKRFLIADVLFLCPLAALFFYRLFERFSLSRSSPVLLKSAASVFIFLLVIIPIANPSTPEFHLNTWHASDPNQQQADDFLASQPGFFRVMVSDRFYEFFPQFTMKGAIDGWYDQATTQLYRNSTLVLYYCGSGHGVLQGLRLLGVRYVMIDFGYGGQATSELENYHASTSVFGPPVYNNSDVAIFQVPDSQLVYVSSTPPRPLSRDIASFRQDVACGESIPGAPLHSLNNSISNLDWREDRISFDVDVKQSAFVVVSNSYSAGWLAEDNGSALRMSLTPPGLPVINVTSGLHHIVVYYSISSSVEIGAILSLIALGGVLIYATNVVRRLFLRRLSA